jgi:hypothetical protein
MAPTPSAEANGAEKGKGYNPVRGAKVIEYARHVLDRTAAEEWLAHRLHRLRCGEWRAWW